MRGAPGKIKKRNKTILLAEDDRTVRKMVGEMLAMDGYDVISAADGTEAYEHFKDRPSEIDLLITDVVMPEMNGKDLGRYCRTDAPEIGILFMSGYVDNRLDPEEDFQGRTDFIAKPFRPREFLKKVEVLLDE